MVSSLIFFQDLFFKYSLNNFLHAQVEDCIRLVFAWNNLGTSKNDENDVPKSPTHVSRVKTPPTVEMVEEADEDCKKSEDLEQVEQDGATAATQPALETQESNEEDSKSTENKEDHETPETFPNAEDVYDNPLLVDVRTEIPKKSAKFAVSSVKVLTF